MSRGIDNAIAGLTEDEKKTLDFKSIEFKGFDGNNDRHYSFYEISCRESRQI
jgi:hypothetical protein